MDKIYHNSDFRYDLAVGQLKGEDKFHEMLSNSKIEVKYDKKTRETGNVYIEFESRGKPSGIATSEADYWAYFTNEDECFVISTKKLKEKLRKLNPPRVNGGDNNTSVGLLVKLKELI